MNYVSNLPVAFVTFIY